MIPIYLASKSPRRYDLLKQGGLSFEVVDHSVDESRYPEEAIVDMVKRLALEKAESVKKISEGLIIGCDTVVELDGELLIKPVDLPDAVRTLRKLSGRMHLVHSGLCIIKIPEDLVSITVTTTKVFFIKLDLDEIHAYFKSEDIMSCAGAYKIQERGAFFVKKIDGSYSNVVGLPLETFYKETKKLGIRIF
ncbi:MAG: septum formation protein Maf [Spirochaetes bacterium]|nr:septum formation protein Maf [Spirochaetota bacterium]